MNILEEIKVRWCSDNLLDNGGFETYTENGNIIFDNWSNFIGGAVLKDLGYKGDVSAKLVTSDEGLRSSIRQIVNVSDIQGKSIIFSIAHKASGSIAGSIYIRDLTNQQDILYEAINVSDINNWMIYYYSFEVPQGCDNLYFKLRSPSENSAFVLLDDAKLYHIDEQEIDIDLIEDKSLSDIKREIEDDLFTFKGDNFNFKIRNNHSSPGAYFDNQRFTTDDKLFSLCIKFNLFYKNEIVNRFLTYFVDRKSCGRDVNYDKDIINISAFELSGLLQDKGWFIGKYIYEVPTIPTKVTLYTPQGILETGDWSIIQIGNDLVFMYKGAEKYRIEI